MASFNRVILLGNLTRDPELRFTPAGQAIVEFGLAVNRRYKTRDSGEDREETCFVNITVWGNQAKPCADYLRKGSQALVEGRLKYDEWEKDGQKRSRLSVTASRVQFLGSPRGAEFQDGPQGAAAQAPTPSSPTPSSPAPSSPAPSEPAPSEPATGGGDMPARSESGDDDNLPF